jgi:hypothetical protein
MDFLAWTASNRHERWDYWKVVGKPEVGQKRAWRTSMFIYPEADFWPGIRFRLARHWAASGIQMHRKRHARVVQLKLPGCTTDFSL